MNKFLKELMTLATELNEAEGFNALTVINDMELLYDKHVNELKKLHIADVRLSLLNGTPQETADKYVKTKLEVVKGLLNEDYKTGYFEGITHFIEDNCNEA